jgi:hypothetical protein
MPLTLLRWLGFQIETLFPPIVEQVGWAAIFASSYLAWIAMRMQDARQGIRHPAIEFLALPLLTIYFSLQSLLFADAFIEEFILRRRHVFAKTHKTGTQFADAKPRIPWPATHREAE